MTLGLIARRATSNGVGVPNQSLQVIYATGAMPRIYQDAAGTQLLSATGHISTDAQGWIHVYVTDAVEYWVRVLSPVGAVLHTVEGVFPLVTTNTQVTLTGNNLEVFSASQLSAVPSLTGVPAALPSGSLMLPNGTLYTDPNASVDLKINGAVLGNVHTINLQSPNLTGFVTGSEATLTFGAPTAAVVVKEEGVALAPQLSEINFVGAGVSAAATGTVVTVTVPGNPLRVLDEDLLLTPNATSVNFRGAGVTATTLGSDTTVTISGNALMVRDEGLALTPAAATMNFVGDGITATAVGNDITVTSQRTPLTTAKGATDFATDTRRLNFQGAGVTVTGVGTEAQINIPATTVSAYDGSTALAAAISKITVTGGGATFTSPTANEVVLNVPASLNEIIVPVSTGMNITAAHHGQRIVMSAATAQPVIVDANLPGNFRCRIVQAGAGRVVVGAGPGTTVTSAEGTYTTNGVGSVLDLVQTGSNTYALSGDLQPLHTEVWSVNGFSGNVLLDVNHVPGAVARVNGLAPDVNGNVAIDGSALVGVVRSVNGIMPTLTGDAVIPAATTSASGLMTAADKVLLNGLSGGSGGGGVTDLSSTYTPTLVNVVSSTGADTVLTAATAAQAGVMTAADKVKLDGLVTGSFTPEAAQDAAAEMFMNGVHPNLDIIYNDPPNTINISVTGTDLNLVQTPTQADFSIVTGAGVTLLPATSTVAGLMTAEDRVKFDQLPVDAAEFVEQVEDSVAALLMRSTLSGVTVAYNDLTNTLNLTATGSGSSLATDLSLGTATATTLPLNISTGAGVVLPAATATTAGLMTAAQFTQLAAATPAATDTVSGTVQLAVAANYPANDTASNDTAAATPAYVKAALFAQDFADIKTALNKEATLGGNSSAGSLLFTSSMGGTTLWQTGNLVAAAAGGSLSATPTNNGVLRQLIARATNVGPEVDSWLIMNSGEPSGMMNGSYTYDANGAILNAPVLWPDGGTGVYTATTVSVAFPGSTDAYTITYVGATGSPWEGVSKTVTQPAVTRNGVGRVTTRPVRTVA